MNLAFRLLKVMLGFACLLSSGGVSAFSGVATARSYSDQIYLAQSVGDWSTIIGDPPPFGGGPRNPCGGQVTPLVPVTQKGDKKYYFGYTTQALPTFRFHVPYKPEAITSSKFFLRYQGGRIEYETSLKITAPGIIQVSLPPNQIKELAVGQWYEAELQVTAFCSEDKPQQTVLSSLWVQRRNLTTPIGSTLPPHQQIAFYRKEHLWFEALEEAVKLERIKPGSSDWQELLSSVGLKEQAKQPILDCCSSPQSPPKQK